MRKFFVEQLQPQDGQSENGGDHSYNEWTILILSLRSAVESAKSLPNGLFYLLLLHVS